MQYWPNNFNLRVGYTRSSDLIYIFDLVGFEVALAVYLDNGVP